MIDYVVAIQLLVSIITIFWIVVTSLFTFLYRRELALFFRALRLTMRVLSILQDRVAHLNKMSDDELAETVGAALNRIGV